MIFVTILQMRKKYFERNFLDVNLTSTQIYLLSELVAFMWPGWLDILFGPH